MNEASIVRGQAFFEANAWMVNFAFLMAALPLSYCGADGARLLQLTGQLDQKPKRRVFETALLLLELAQPGSLAVGQPGYLTIRRLRLLHGVVRRTVQDHPLPPGASGPINQLDLLGMVWNFALTPLDVCAAMGVKVRGDERQGWLHLWNLVGDLLGIQHPDGDALFPMDEPEARACFAAVKARQFEASPEGVKLTASLSKMVKDLVPLQRWDWVVDGCMRHYLGPEHADMVEIPKVDAGSTISVVRRVLARDWSRRRRLATQLPRRREVGAELLRGLSVWHLDRADGMTESLREPGADQLLTDVLAGLHAQELRPEAGGRVRRLLRTVFRRPDVSLGGDAAVGMRPTAR